MHSNLQKQVLQLYRKTLKFSAQNASLRKYVVAEFRANQFIPRKRFNRVLIYANVRLNFSCGKGKISLRLGRTARSMVLIYEKSNIYHTQLFFFLS